MYRSAEGPSQAHAERIVAVVSATVVVEIESTSVAIAVIAPTFEERIARVREIGVSATV